MNQEKHWNRIAPTYNQEIFDVFAGDQKRILFKYFNVYASKKHTALDFGCGIGKAFPYLATRFKKVVAIDISDECLNEARKTSYKNISFQQADLAQSRIKLPTVDFLFCCNVIMLPEPERNIVMLRNVRKALKPNGAAVIVMPSMESYLFSVWQLFRWYGKEGVSPQEVSADEYAGFTGPRTDILRGILQINGVKTKHYSASELDVIFREAGLTIKNLEKVEYSWHTEFSSPPQWMKAPYPWDWLIECRPV